MPKKSKRKELKDLAMKCAKIVEKQDDEGLAFIGLVGENVDETPYGFHIITCVPDKEAAVGMLVDGLTEVLNTFPDDQRRDTVEEITEALQKTFLADKETSQLMN